VTNKVKGRPRGVPDVAPVCHQFRCIFSSISQSKFKPETYLLTSAGLKVRFRESAKKPSSDDKAEDPFRVTTFRLRKRLVPTENIERYRKDHSFFEEAIMPDAGMPINKGRSTVALNNLLTVTTPSDVS